MPDIERLHRLLDWAAAEDEKALQGLPSEWDQRIFVAKYDCGTACCIAGKVALEDGGQPIWAKSLHGGLVYSSMLDFPGRRTMVPADEYAEAALGLTATQADALFAPENDIDDLRRIVALIEQGVDDERVLYDQ